MTLFIPAHIEVLFFDAFGTLVEIAEQRGVMARLRQAAGEAWPKLRRRLLTQPFEVADWRRECVGGDGGAEFDLGQGVETLAADLAAEVASIRLFDDVPPALARFRQADKRLHVISNLASCYGPRLCTLTAPWIDGWSLSYEIGAIKPDPAIFAHACQAADCVPAAAMMIGDSLQSDIRGASQAGMTTAHIARGGDRDLRGRAIQSLDELVVDG